MSGARFRYALQPVLLTRQWALDALRRELNDRNAALDARRVECDGVREQLAQAGRQWTALGSDQQFLSVDRYTLLARYIGDRGLQLRALEQALATLVRERDEVISQVVVAQRALEAVEDHRERMHGRFIQARLSGDFKAADDQWGVLQRGRASHDE